MSTDAYVARTDEERAGLNWGKGWRPVEPDDGLQRQLLAELSREHPLAPLEPRVLGRCLMCDDIVVGLRHAAGEPDLAVVHLTWAKASSRPSAQRNAWPFFERLERRSFVERFLLGGEHL